jgi:hypothetical protein
MLLAAAAFPGIGAGKVSNGFDSSTFDALGDKASVIARMMGLRATHMELTRGLVGFVEVGHDKSEVVEIWFRGGVLGF